jgi:hypothetical protein
MFDAWSIAHKRLLQAELEVVSHELQDGSAPPSPLLRKVRVLKKRADRLFERAILLSGAPSEYDLTVMHTFETRALRLQ